MDPALAVEVAGLSRQKTMNEATAKGDSPVQQFYADAVVLITGGSGFLGKQLAEKILRSCQNLKKVYLLIRPKKGKTVHARLDEILQDPVHAIIRKKYPTLLDKLVPMEGDVTKIGIGISEEDRNKIIEEVEVIFHAAATTRFDDKLKHATLSNIRGTREMLALAKQCRKLRSVVYISTAYCQATKDRIKGHILEKFYESPIPPNTLIEMAETLTEDQLDEITATLIQNWPNTYTYTKAVTEELIRQIAEQLPICIIRPSIMIASYSEPSPGWLDKSCAFGATGLVLLGPCLGILHVLLADGSFKVDLIPADMVNNAAIVAGWETARRWQAGDKDIRIYMSGNYRNHLHSGTMKQHLENNLKIIPSPKTLYHCGVIQTKYKPVAYVLYWLLHFIPAYLIDGAFIMIGRKPVLNDLYAKAWKSNRVQSFFTRNEWIFIDDNTKNMYDRMSKEDKSIFNFDPTVFNWREMLMIWNIGVRKYIIKDGLKDTDIGKKRIFWFKILNYCIVVLYLCCWWKCIFVFIGLLLKFCKDFPLYIE